MPQVLTLSHCVPWDSLFLVVVRSAQWGHHLCSRSPGLVGELKVMNAGELRSKGKKHTTEVKEKGSYGSLFPPPHLTNGETKAQDRTGFA